MGKFPEFSVVRAFRLIPSAPPTSWRAVDQLLEMNRNSTAPGKPVDATLLLVNDDADELYFLRRAIRRVLPALNLVEVNSAAAALELFSRGGVTAIVTDNRMPLMDGVELVKLIRRRDPIIPIIMVSGLPNAEPSARNAGVNAFIPVDKLQEAVMEIVRVLSAREMTGDAATSVAAEFHI